MLLWLLFCFAPGLYTRACFFRPPHGAFSYRPRLFPVFRARSFLAHSWRARLFRHRGLFLMVMVLFRRALFSTWRVDLVRSTLTPVPRCCRRHGHGALPFSRCRACAGLPTSCSCRCAGARRAAAARASRTAWPTCPAAPCSPPHRAVRAAAHSPCTRPPPATTPPPPRPPPATLFLFFFFYGSVPALLFSSHPCRGLCACSGLPPHLPHPFSCRPARRAFCSAFAVCPTPTTPAAARRALPFALPVPHILHLLPCSWTSGRS